MYDTLISPPPISDSMHVSGHCFHCHEEPRYGGRRPLTRSRGDLAEDEKSHEQVVTSGTNDKHTGTHLQTDSIQAAEHQIQPAALSTGH